MATRCYSRRILAPFHGTLQVVSVPHGDAESTDGVHWVLYVMHEEIVAHTGLSEIRYGTWHRDSGLKRAAIRGTARSHLIEEVGARLIAALEEAAGRVPFAPADHWECWLLDADQERPLALLESAVSELEPPPMECPRWVPGQGARKEFVSPHGGAESLSAIVAEAAGRACWLYRDAQGGGWAGDGCAWPVEQFPPLLLRERWSQPNQAALVRDFLAWQAPWLLQLTGLGPGLRARLEASAWRRARETDRVFRLFPRLLDVQGLTVTRVKARLLADKPPPQWDAEPFLPFYLE